MNRDQVIIRTSVIGILANVLLAAFKAFVGILSHSIAVVLDAVNNLSDALSSLITIIGTKLALKPADKEHPYGYGRIEYLSAAIISVIVLYAGITSLTESVKKIINPEVPDYSPASLIVIGAAVVVKLLLGRYVKATGEKVDSASLVNSGEDAVNDSIISFSTLVSAVIYMLFHISLEAWLGLIISGVIIKSGIDLLKDTFSRILGERIDGELAKQLKADIASYDGVYGAYDLNMHDYGPDRMMGSIHVEVPDYYTADQLDQMTRNIQTDIYDKHHVVLTAVGFYARNMGDNEAADILNHVREIVDKTEHVSQMHGFHVNTEKKTIRFDIVVGFQANDRHAAYEEVLRKVQEEWPDYQIRIVMASDTSD